MRQKSGQQADKNHSIGIASLLFLCSPTTKIATYSTPPMHLDTSLSPQGLAPVD